jgi:hypothetical protein
MSILRIIFILSNIYENINGVSTKYIKFIEYLSNINYLGSKIDIVLFIPSNKDNNEKENIKIIKTSGIKIPFYKDIKIPIISTSSLLSEIKTGKEIIIFNGEFFWLYEKLKKVQKKFNRVKIFPNMHTDYDFYLNNIYTKFSFGFKPLKKHLDYYLDKKYFEGIIVTGEKLREKYNNITNNVFNANEIDLAIFKNYKIDNYKINSLELDLLKDNDFEKLDDDNNLEDNDKLEKDNLKDDKDNLKDDNDKLEDDIKTENIINFIYCGRVSKEKNIIEICECLNEVDFNYVLNIIGDGPYINELKNIIIEKYNNSVDKIYFHGELKQREIYNLYHKLDNRIFIFTSLSETFGKTPMEAGMCGVPIFIKKSDITPILYTHEENAYIFDNKYDFKVLLYKFLKSGIHEKKSLIENSVKNIKKYDQNIIFNNLLKFLIQSDSKLKILLNFFDIFAFHSMSKMVNCSSMFLGE